jgi:hypothetical protein
VKPLVEAMFGFETGHSKKAIARNRKLAEELKEGYNFAYEVQNLVLFFITNGQIVCRCVQRN